MAASVLAGIGLSQSQVSIASANGPWGGYGTGDNGRIPLAALTPVVYPGVAPGAYQDSLAQVYLQPDAAAALLALLQAYHAETGGYLPVAEGYRTLAGQQYWFDYYNHDTALAARPGTSNHGWGEAVDFNQTTLIRPAQLAWIQAHCSTYGYAVYSKEFWHFNYVGPTTNLPPSNSTGTSLHQISGTTTGWIDGALGVSLPGALVSAVNTNDPWPEIMALSGGHLYQIYGNTAGWHTVDTGVTINASSISAVNMGGIWPQVMANVGGILYQIYGDTTGWHVASTGLSIGSGPISAVNMGGSWPQVMVSNGGVLYQVNADSSGWHMNSTSLTAGDGDISAVAVSGESWPQTYIRVGGQLYEVYGNTTGWHLANTLMPAGDGHISAVNVGETWPRIMTTHGGQLYQVSVYSGDWHSDNTEVAVGSGSISAVYIDGSWPQVIAVE